MTLDFWRANVQIWSTYAYSTSQTIPFLLKFYLCFANYFPDKFFGILMIVQYLRNSHKEKMRKILFIEPAMINFDDLKDVDRSKTCNLIFEAPEDIYNSVLQGPSKTFQDANFWKAAYVFGNMY